MSDDIRLENVAIWGHALVEEAEVGEVLTELKSIEVPDVLDKQMVSVNEEDPEGATIFYADKMPTGPGPAMISKGSVNMLSIQYDGEHLSISSDIDSDLLGEFVKIYDEIITITDVHIAEFDTSFVVDRNPESLTVSIKGPDEFDFVGYQFIEDETKFSVKSGTSPENNDDDIADELGDDTTIIETERIEHFDESESGEFIRVNVNNSETTIDKLTP